MTTIEIILACMSIVLFFLCIYYISECSHLNKVLEDRNQQIADDEKFHSQQRAFLGEELARTKAKHQKELIDLKKQRINNKPSKTK